MKPTADLIAKCDQAVTAGRRARDAFHYTGVPCRNIHRAVNPLLAYCWDAGYSGTRKQAKRLIRDFALPLTQAGHTMP